jgi:hypothetical protein
MSTQILIHHLFVLDLRSAPVIHPAGGTRNYNIASGGVAVSRGTVAYCWGGLHQSRVVYNLKPFTLSLSSSFISFTSLPLEGNPALYIFHDSTAVSNTQTALHAQHLRKVLTYLQAQALLTAPERINQALLLV